LIIYFLQRLLLLLHELFSTLLYLLVGQTRSLQTGHLTI